MDGQRTVRKTIRDRLFQQLATATLTATNAITTGKYGSSSSQQTNLVRREREVTRPGAAKGCSAPNFGRHAGVNFGKQFSYVSV